jgi:hypothetical protein
MTTRRPIIGRRRAGKGKHAEQERGGESFRLVHPATIAIAG